MVKKYNPLDQWKVKPKKNNSFTMISIMICLVMASFGLIVSLSSRIPNLDNQQEIIYTLKSNHLTNNQMIISPKNKSEIELNITQNGKQTNKYILQALFLREGVFSLQKDNDLKIAYSSFYSKPNDYISSNETKIIKIIIDNQTNEVQTIKFEVNNYKINLHTNIVDVFYEGDFKITATIDGKATKFYPNTSLYNPKVECKSIGSLVDVTSSVIWNIENNKWDVSFKDIFHAGIDCNIDFISVKKE